MGVSNESLSLWTTVHFYQLLPICDLPPPWFLFLVSAVFVSFVGRCVMHFMNVHIAKFWCTMEYLWSYYTFTRLPQECSLDESPKQAQIILLCMLVSWGVVLTISASKRMHQPTVKNEFSMCVVTWMDNSHIFLRIATAQYNIHLPSLCVITLNENSFLTES